MHLRTLGFRLALAQGTVAGDKGLPQAMCQPRPGPQAVKAQMGTSRGPTAASQTLNPQP